MNHHLQTQEVDVDSTTYGLLGLVRNPDGSITRQFEHQNPLNASSNSLNPFFLFKDIPINQSNGTWMRLLVPRVALNSIHDLAKLPLIIYFHGGGFILGCAGSPVFDDFYTAVVTGIPAVLVSVEYRLSPEHRLPAAYDDCMEALHGIKNSDEEWLTKYVDFSKVFLMGGSAGGNIVYHVGLRAAACVDDLKPLEIKGLILQQAYFGGTKRTASELRLANDEAFPLHLNDLMWELALPIGVDRDHQYSNPFLIIKPDEFDRAKRLGWKVLVTGCSGDPLIDRQVEMVKMLENNGVSVVSKFIGGGFHGYEMFETSKARLFSAVVKEFIFGQL